LSGKNCLNGVSLFMFHSTHKSQYIIIVEWC
jgi:hypothetical protein